MTEPKIGNPTVLRMCHLCGETYRDNVGHDDDLCRETLLSRQRYLQTQLREVEEALEKWASYNESKPNLS